MTTPYTGPSAKAPSRAGRSEKSILTKAGMRIGTFLLAYGEELGDYSTAAIVFIGALLAYQMCIRDSSQRVLTR